MATPPLAIKRAQKEFKTLSESSHAGHADVKGVRLVKDDNILVWAVTLAGPSGSPYDGGFFQVNVELTAEYPHRPPKLTFLTKIWHPGVDATTGKLCEALFAEWAPTMSVADALSLVVDVLRAPWDHLQEVNLVALQQLQASRAEFTAQAAAWTQQHATL
jgi:ubiquitin-protein ligase